MFIFRAVCAEEWNIGIVECWNFEETKNKIEMSG